MQNNNERNEEPKLHMFGPCPKCAVVGSEKSGFTREPGQGGRTRCGSCMEATPNRAWPDFKTVLSAAEEKSVAAKHLALIGMAALTPDEIVVASNLSEIAAKGNPGNVAQAFGCIIVGYALKKYDQQRATRKAVNEAISTVREQRMQFKVKGLEAGGDS